MDRFVKRIATNSDDNNTVTKKVVADRDGALIELYPNFLPAQESQELFKELKALDDWKIREIMTVGGLKMTSRLVMVLFHPDAINEGTILTRSRIDDSAKEKRKTFTPLLMHAHEKIKELTGETFNFALLNYYRDGQDHVGFHSDSRDSLTPGSTIASLSIGATRDFVIRHIGDTRLAQNMSDDKLRLEALEKAKTKVSLKTGSLLLMKKRTQEVYHHHVPKRLNVKSPRINITFRHIMDSSAYEIKNEN